MYDLQASEIMFYVDILCDKYNASINDIEQLTKLFNNVLELPISEGELTSVISNYIEYEERRIYQCLT